MEALRHIGAREDSLTQCRLVETALNARLTVACSLGGADFCGKAFGRMLPWEPGSTALRTVRLANAPKTGASDRQLGQPDLLLLGERDLVMVEMKVRGAASKARYDAPQLRKYLNLATYAFRHLAVERVCHLILTPRADPSPFFRASEWVERIDEATGEAVFRIDRLAVAARNGWTDYLSRAWWCRFSRPFPP